ncbi:MAG: glutamate dehydrogenase, partial [Pseudomonadota bacterium]
VTVSYFEWVKNIGHIRFGRLQRRQEERKTTMMVKAVEQMTGKSFPIDLLEDLIAGPTELDLVRSGLDDTMRLAYQEISKTRRDNSQISDLRTAAYVVSIEKISRSYLDIGVY